MQQLVLELDLEGDEPTLLTVNYTFEMGSPATLTDPGEPDNLIIEVEGYDFDKLPLRVQGIIEEHVARAIEDAANDYDPTDEGYYADATDDIPYDINDRSWRG